MSDLKVMFPRYFVSLVVVVALQAVAQGSVSLPSLFGDHMVLQRDESVRVWGNASPGEHIEVGFRRQSVATEADASGRWQAFLAPMGAGGPDELTVKGETALVLHDVMVGEVWIASGQSNMRWTVKQSNNSEQEIAAANFPQIRYFQVPQKVSDTAQTDVVGSWRVVTPESVPGFSAIGYFFARQLAQKLQVPVGVIQATYGNTPAQAWVRREVLASDPLLSVYFNRWDAVLAAYPAVKARYDGEFAEWKSVSAKAKADNRTVPAPPVVPEGPGHPATPGGLFNAMIAPLTPLTIRGVIWYQGENNTKKDDAPLYHRLFSSLITDWRRAWGEGDVPFLFAQLSIDRGQNSWPELRDAQRQTLKLRNTAMVVTADVGEPIGQHPTDKQSVGDRFAHAARAIAYHEPMVYCGPLYRRVTAEPNGKLRVWFDWAGDGLRSRDSQPLRQFWISGEDRVFVSATATIDGSTLLVSSDAVKAPVAVRYAWVNDIRAANLVNAEGLPASPFRSDDWEQTAALSSTGGAVGAPAR